MSTKAMTFDRVWFVCDEEMRAQDYNDDAVQNVQILLRLGARKMTLGRILYIFV